MPEHLRDMERGVSDKGAQGSPVVVNTGLQS